MSDDEPERQENPGHLPHDMRADDTPQLVHIEVDGPPQQAREWREFVRNNPVDGYQFIITTGDETMRPVVDRDELVSDIADAVVERLETDQGGGSDE